MKTQTFICTLIMITLAFSPGRAQEEPIMIKGARLFDGSKMIENGAIIFKNGIILSVGKQNQMETPPNVRILDYPAGTIMPGMIEGHAHILLHPYNETTWNDQVLKESIAERAIRAAQHAENTLLAGFTTVRDLGSEGAGFADVGVKEAIEKGLVVGPDLIVSGPAIVATGSYGPKGFNEKVKVPLGAHEADGDDLIRETREQIGGGADFIKVYADYRWGPEGKAMPTFTIDELKRIVEIAQSSGRQVVAHASTEEGMRRATLAGVVSIEHGDGGTKEVFELMKAYGVALCPTLAAGDAISQYQGWQKGIEPEPDRIINKRRSFSDALDSGVTIIAGGDVGVFSHGDNVRELEMMVDYGMDPLSVLKSVTSVNAKVFGIEHKTGRLESGKRADIVVVEGDPSRDISTLRNIHAVILRGKIIKR